MKKKNKRIQVQKIPYIALVIVFVVVILGALYFSLIYMPHCQNYDCWQKHMSRCSKAVFINEEPEATWKYQIKGKDDGMCEIEVTMLMAKKGDLAIEEFIGHKMTCHYPLNVVAYAEKDLGRCSGQLKEDLQTVIINKLHAYILENLEDIEVGLKSI